MAQHAAAFKGKERDLGIGLLRCCNVCFCRIYHNVTVQTPCQLPREGPAILVSNHISGLDPVLIQAACPRLIRWMMAKEYYEQKGLKWLLDLVGIIPVNRGGRDLAATRTALAALEDGYVVGVFPEGKIETARRLLPFQAGIALLAAKSQAPIHPVYLEGTQRGKNMLRAYFQPNSTSLSFGRPFALEREQIAALGFEKAALQVQSAVEILRKSELERRKYQCKSMDQTAHSC